ncbi:GntR family transcriptional regulator [Spirosoma fluviale]|uniref:DNA-binding transcriptional regulator YhcF, GntR family n=1 Tax=Spirosoma fluviale TaxID=1597977 RepID=A0A286G9Y1_9BACT|nr:GntR family transcriptional regulator [Spirosoma fluviale]SOD92272.1 DNA-binding transcriptional regulator YhcF, GntR family [Spirosoma fluviale]
MDFKDRQSIYWQIAERICEDILQGKWNEGERIPSVRDLAISLQVNPHTILRSYEYLQNKHIIINKRGLGYSVAPLGKEQIMANRKDRFIESDLPSFFFTLDLLNMSIEEVLIHYEVHRRKTSTIETNFHPNENKQ